MDNPEFYVTLERWFNRMFPNNTETQPLDTSRVGDDESTTVVLVGTGPSVQLITIGNEKAELQVRCPNVSLSDAISSPVVRTSAIESIDGRSLAIGASPDCECITIGNVQPGGTPTAITIGGPQDTVTFTNATAVHLTAVTVENGTTDMKNIEMNKASDAESGVSPLVGQSGIGSGLRFCHYEPRPEEPHAKDEWLGSLTVESDDPTASPPPPPSVLQFQATAPAGVPGGTVRLCAPPPGELGYVVLSTSKRDAVLTSDTPSASYSTGALVVPGGAGIGGALNIGGNITCGGDISAFSDARLKQDVALIEGALARVRSLRGVTFRRTDDEAGRRHAGLIAQDVERVLPEAVHAREGDGMLSVSYGNLVGVLVEAIKELASRVEELERLAGPLPP